MSVVVATELASIMGDVYIYVLSCTYSILTISKLCKSAISKRDACHTSLPAFFIKVAIAICEVLAPEVEIVLVQYNWLF